MTCGIYLLEFNGTEKVYVGLSNNVEKRYKQHTNKLNNNEHTKKLMDAFLLYGTPTLRIILECDESELISAEQEAIEIFDSINNGFNSSSAGIGCSLVGDSSPHAKYSNTVYENAFLLMVKSNNSYEEISSKLNIDLSILYSISSGQSHLWLKSKYPKEYEILLNKKRAYSTITTDQIEKAFRLLLDTQLSHAQIANSLNINKSAISGISAGTRYLWLKDKFPEEYKLLINARGNRHLKKEVYLKKGSVIEKVTNIRAFCKKYNIDASGISKVINKKLITSKGWSLV